MQVFFAFICFKTEQGFHVFVPISGKKAMPQTIRWQNYEYASMSCKISRGIKMFSLSTAIMSSTSWYTKGNQFDVTKCSWYDVIKCMYTYSAINLPQDIGIAMSFHGMDTRNLHTTFARVCHILWWRRYLFDPSAWAGWCWWRDHQRVVRDETIGLWKRLVKINSIDLKYMTIRLFV